MESVYNTNKKDPVNTLDNGKPLFGANIFTDYIFMANCSAVLQH